ncbi:hypothetical protein GCM10009555_069040 [Acrocarpospora macrocephala]|uniref:Uncharacterized protein n=1 Tax=Acrocarpospora macrocephala TaxID=150177 RepID=A0A5M3X4I7_9ACTN|nr:hypothetical protein Amac_096180 [Acrocarpospora macrocephala]
MPAFLACRSSSDWAAWTVFFTALAKIGPSDFRYTAYRLADSVTFVHVGNHAGSDNPSAPSSSATWPSAASHSRRRPGGRRRTAVTSAARSVILSISVAVVVPKDFKCPHQHSALLVALFCCRCFPDGVINAATRGLHSASLPGHSPEGDAIWLLAP